MLKSLFSGRTLEAQIENAPALLIAGVTEAISNALAEEPAPSRESTLLETAGWLTAGLGALAIGLFVGRELRSRYKFNRRTPYDFYAHSGDERHDMEFGGGI